MNPMELGRQTEAKSCCETAGRLEHRVHAYLCSKSYPHFGDLNVQSEGGIVTVSGKVASEHHRQIAVRSCRRVAGVVALIDAIEVDAIVAKDAELAGESKGKRGSNRPPR